MHFINDYPSASQNQNEKAKAFLLIIKTDFKIIIM